MAVRDVVEASPGRYRAADAVERLWWDRWRVVATVRAELGLPPLTGQPTAFGCDAADPR